MKKIFNYLFGYLRVQADGQFTERFINICMHRGIPIWDIKKCGKSRITFKISPKMYKNIRTPAFRTKSRVRITEKNGVPFIVRRYSKRKFVVGGAAVLCLILWYTSTHIMGISVYGNSRISTQEIMEALKNEGIKLGAESADIVPDSVRNNLMSKLDELAWVGINANGSRVYVEIVERIEKEEGLEKDDIACNLIASKDGEIESIIVREGQTQVIIGSGVRRGDVLVSGIVDSNVSGFRYVKARGEVYAKTRYSKTRCYPLEYTEEIPVDEIKKRYKISVMNFEIPLYFSEKAPFENYIYEYEQKEYSTPFEIVPSLFISSEEFRRTTAEDKKRTPAEAVELGRYELSEELKGEISEECEIIKQDSSYTLNERGEAEVTVELLCREDIAEPMIIEKTLPENDY